MIKDLELNTIAIASKMALGLSIVHWQAQVNSMDMEFVLGSATERDIEQQGYVVDTLPQEAHQLNFAKRSTHLWMLDSNKASWIRLTANDVDSKLVPAFLGNDPYYPCPDVDKELWEIFCETYLQASKLILQSKN